jgi:ABC-type Mn2+/Zn2+ transport system ATPase subunit
MALIPEDRKTEGLMLPMSIGENLSMAALGGLTNGPLIDRGREAEAIEAMVEKLRIKIGSVDDPVATLSGGNQQKVVIGKWLMTSPKDHPAQRPDPRHRRRHQAGALPAACATSRPRAPPSSSTPPTTTS